MKKVEKLECSQFQLRSWIYCCDHKDSLFSDGLQHHINGLLVRKVFWKAFCEVEAEEGVWYWNPDARKRPSPHSQQPSPGFLLTCSSLTATCRLDSQLDHLLPHQHLTWARWPPAEPATCNYLLLLVSIFCNLYLSFATYIYLLQPVFIFCHLHLSFATCIYHLPHVSIFCHLLCYYLLPPAKIIILKIKATDC